VRVFKYTRFSRFADKEGISDQELLQVVDLLEKDHADVKLGGGVFKQRIAREGEGKSGGYRVIVYFKNKFRTFFSYGFAKSDKGNINKKELKELKRDAKKQLSLTDAEIRLYLIDGTYIEIPTNITEED